MKHPILFLSLWPVLLAFVGGCTKFQAPEQSLNPRDIDGSLAVSAEYTDGIWRDSITVFVNGEEIISEPLSAYEDKGDFNADYQGIPIYASCYPQTHFRLVTECIVSLESGEKTKFIFKTKQ